DGRDFAAEEDILLVPDPSVQVHVDMSLKVQTLESRGAGIVATDAQSGDAGPIPDKSLKLVDWEKAYFDLLDYKERKGFGNLIVQSDVPERILTYTEPKSLYRLVADESVVKPRSFGDAARLQEAVTNVLRKYMDAFYRSRRERWESNYLVFKTLHESDPNLSFNYSDEVKDDDYAGRYMINVQQSESELISEIQKFINDFDQLCEEEIEELPRIYFDRHLYHPLLKAHRDEIRLSPLGLNDSESQFIQDLKDFWASEKDELLAGTEVFLLRNLERGRGVGFFEERGFYPDFILWIIAEQQHIVFVEPHGMLHANAYRHDDKARLHERLPELAKEIGMRSNRQDVTLDSYIISATPYEDLYQRYDDGSWDIERFAGKHILFCEQDDYMKRIFEEQLAQV
ncbi:MAG: restriction endonuclease subunit R, partial [Gemmatimonadota bacterium]|nr:restriction endonuclease subunit R [Gemmatimonadota bacterium]